MADREPLIALRGVEKDYHSLRPLRVRHLELREGESLALLGFDQASAEALVNLIAGATIPDTGEVIVRGRPTTAIGDAEAWMRALDDFGILSERAPLLEQMTAEQNLAVPLSLELHDLPLPVRSQVSTLAEEVGLEADRLPQFTSVLSRLDRMRVRLARALAVKPRILLAEHPHASLEPAERPVFAELLSRVATRRRPAMIVLTADRTFAAAVADDVRTLNPATGELTRQAAGWRRWFR